VGMNESAARDALISDGFRVVTSDDATSTADQGTVVRQDPPAGVRRPYRSTVVIYVSTGPPTTPSTSTPTTETTSTGTTTTTPPAP
jgi:beta-lactam-binding protein with PASTA domain